MLGFYLIWQPFSFDLNPTVTKNVHFVMVNRKSALIFDDRYDKVIFNVKFEKPI